jgi:hypothetical protein
METKAYGIQSPESLAKEYGGNKQKIAKAVQLGILDPTAAVLAGMFIDRVRNAAQEEQGPQTTVAQQVLGGPPPAPPQGPPQAGLQAAAPAPMRMAYGGQVGVSNNQVPAPAMERGLDGIPIPDNMFDYAGGGMVAFGSGGGPKEKWIESARKVNPTLSYDELSNYYDANIANTPGENLPPSKVNPQGTPLSPRPRAFTSQLPSAQMPLGGGAGQGVFALPSQDSSTRTAGLMSLPGAQGQGAYLGRPLDTALAPDKNITPEMKKFLERKASDLASMFEQNRNVMTAPPGADATGRPNIDPFAAAKQNVLGKESSGAGGVGGPSFAPRSPEDILRSIQGEPRAETAEQYGRRVGQLNVDSAGFAKPEPTLTIKQAMERAKEADKEAGVDPEFFKKLQNRIDTMRGEAETDKTQAANMRLLEAGLNILGGTSPFALVNIGKGASEAVKGFGQDLKEYQKARRELDKAAIELQTSEQNAARTQSAKALDMVDKSQTRFENATNKVAEAKINATNSATNAFINQEQIQSGERRTAAEISSRDRQVAAQLEQSNRQIAESRAARLEAAGLAADQKFVEGLTKAEQGATKPYDDRIKVIETALSNPTASLTPNFIKEQQDKIDDLIGKRAAAANLAREKYIDARKTGRPLQNNAAQNNAAFYVPLISAADKIAGVRK